MRGLFDEPLFFTVSASFVGAPPKVVWIRLGNCTSQEVADLLRQRLESLETLSEEENARLWAEEAERRDRAWDPTASQGRPASDVFGDARGRLE